MNSDIENLKKRVSEIELQIQKLTAPRNVSRESGHAKDLMAEVEADFEREQTRTATKEAEAYRQHLNTPHGAHEYEIEKAIRKSGFGKIFWTVPLGRNRQPTPQERKWWAWLGFPFDD